MCLDRNEVCFSSSVTTPNPISIMSKSLATVQHSKPTSKKPKVQYLFQTTCIDNYGWHFFPKPKESVAAFIVADWDRKIFFSGNTRVNCGSAEEAEAYAFSLGYKEALKNGF